MAIQEHKIGKMLLEFEFGSEQAAMESHQRLTDVQELILELIETYLDELAKPDEVIQIDSIQIDLETLDLGSLDGSIPQRLRQELERTLTKQVTLAREKSNAESVTTDTIQGLRIVKRKQSVAEAFSAYLKTGVFNWSNGSETSDLQDIGFELLRTPELLRNILRDVGRFKTTWQRLAYQFDSDLLIAISEVTEGSFQSEIGKFIQSLFRIFPDKKAQVWQTVIEQTFLKPVDTLETLILASTSDLGVPLIRHENESTQTRSLLSFYRAALLKEDAFLQTTLVKLLQEKELAEALVPLDDATTIKHILELPTDESPGQKVEENQATKADSAIVPSTSDVVETNISSADQKQLSREDKARHESEPADFPHDLYINNAGVVLTANFLPFLFEGLGITVEQAFVDEAAQIKGIYLIQYIATGVAEAKEPELVFNKMLCDIPINQPIPPVVALSERELEAADQLIQVVIDRWGALGQTDINALRGSFFVREGVLTKEDNGWKLKVERKTFDMLLDKLPWSYATLKLPWHEDFISVQW